MSKKNKKQQNVIIDNVNVAELEHTALMKFTQKLYDELLKERQNRSTYQIERDQMRIFWEITKQNLTTLMADMVATQNEAGDNAQRVEQVKKRARQQRLQLVYEQNLELKQVKSQNSNVLKSIAAECDRQITELFNVNSSLKQTILHNALDHTNQIKNIKVAHVQELDAKAEVMQNQMSQIMERIEKKRQTVVEGVLKKHELGVALIENAKERQVKMLLEKHKNEFDDMHSYYQELLVSTQTLVSVLKEKLEMLSIKTSSTDKYVSSLERENQHFKGLLEKANGDIIRLEQKMIHFKKNKKSLEYNKKELKKCMERYENLMVENGALEIRYDQKAEVYRSLKDNFLQRVLQCQSESNFGKTLLEKQIVKLDNTVAASE
ncbi:dynein regulatory complex subunit 4-like [Adelges cooleyi]|uniref:dynein regulatory complex subunit 4-like n=1 Tax=Adelges cooleyi TaxID=133065 RepID=UPI002180882B|nr:dynein regulatory complex subunit 4-like [Adelges cooleyi]